MTTPLPTVELTDALFRGAMDLDRSGRGVMPHRLPRWVRQQFPDPQLLMAASQPSGVRLALRTAATVIEIDALRTRREYVGMPPRPDGVYDLFVDGELTARSAVDGGAAVRIDMATGTVEHVDGPFGTVRFAGLPAREKDVELWLPHDEATEVLALRADAPVSPAPDRRRPVWLHHGSSLSQGSGAESPSTTWPAVAASSGDVELVNLGLGGSALLDPFLARTMRDQAADLISIAVGINVVNTDVMRARAFVPAVHGFLDTIRDGHPATPLVVLTPTWCPTHEDTPGPAAPALVDGQVVFRATGDPADVPRGRLTLRVIREQLAAVVAQRSADDPNLHLVHGPELYGAADAELRPLPDGLHPDAQTHLDMGRRFAEIVFAPRGPFGRGR